MQSLAAKHMTERGGTPPPLGEYPISESLAANIPGRVAGGARVPYGVGKARPIGKYSGKRRGPRTQASRFCGIGSMKGLV